MFPEIPGLAERGIGDGVGRLDLQMHERSERLLAGRRISYVSALLRECLDRRGTPGVIACDRWCEAELREKLEAVWFPLTALRVRGAGFRDGVEDVRLFRKSVLAGDVAPTKSLLLRAALLEARTVSDPAGNHKLSKSTQGGRRANARAAAAAACILAVAEGTRRAKRPARRGWRYAVVG